MSRELVIPDSGVFLSPDPALQELDHVFAHEAAGDPHPAYALEADIAVLTGLVIAHDGLNENVSGITNTSYADLDALTGAAFSRSVEVTVTTGTTCLVLLTANVIRANPAAGGDNQLGYAVSGASTIAASGTSKNLRQANSTTAEFTSSAMMIYEDGLTAGSNTFTLQYRQSAGNASQLIYPSITIWRF